MGLSHQGTPRGAMQSYVTCRNVCHGASRVTQACTASWLGPWTRPRRFVSYKPGYSEWNKRFGGRYKLFDLTSDVRRPTHRCLS